MPPTAPKIDKLLAANLAKAKLARAEKPFFFALVLKGGGTSGKLLIDRMKIKPTPIQAAKKATGGSAVLIGICYFDNKVSKLIFETDKAPLPTWQQLVKKLARQEAGLAIEAKFVQAKRPVATVKEPEDDDKDEAGEWEAAKPDAGEAAEQAALEKWNLQLDAVRTKLLEASKAGMPWAKELLLKQSEAGAIYRQGKRPQAQQMLRDVVVRLKQQQSASRPSGANGPQAAARQPAGAGAAAASKPATSQVDLDGVKQSWESALAKVRADQTKLVKAMVGRFKGHPGLPQAKLAAERVVAALKPFDEQLSEVLGQARKSEKPEDRRVWQKRASALVGSYVTRLDTDPVIAMLDTNPLMPVAIHKTLSKTLQWLASKLS